MESFSTVKTHPLAPPASIEAHQKTDTLPPDAYLPFQTIAIAQTQEGKNMVLQENKGAYFFYLGGEMLMGGKHHGSEEALGTLGCSFIQERSTPTVLIGGLGMGFTLRATLDALGPEAHIITAELSKDVIAWNQPDGPLATPAGTPVADPRSHIAQTDLCEIIQQAKPGTYDAILIDTDNEPQALSYTGNETLYTLNGLKAMKQALRADGVLGFWFLRAPASFDDLLRQAGFQPERHDVPCGEGGTHLIILAQPGD